MKILRQIPVIGLHSVQTAKLSALIGKVMNFKVGEVMRLYLLGALHDVGLTIPRVRREYETFSKDKGILDLVRREDLMKNHGAIGSKIVEGIPMLGEYSVAIEEHHTPACNLEIGERFIMANILNIANTISLKLLECDNLADERFKEDFKNYLNQHKSEYFPDVREAALKAIGMEAYMMMATDGENHWEDFAEVDEIMDMSSLMNFLTLMDYLVDFMDEKTEHHSTRVAFLAREIAKELLTESEGLGVYLAGRMHDLGKIFLPSSVVSSRDEDNYLFRIHVIYTYELFDCFRSLPNVVNWAVTHHERLDGSGYPWHLTGKDLSMPARIVQVADEYVTLVEKGVKDAVRSVERKASDGKLDRESVEVLKGLVKNGYNILEYYDVIGMYIKEVDTDG